MGQHAGQPVVRHGGGINGFATHVLSLPESRLFVAILSNIPQGGSDPGMLAQKAASLALGEPIDPEPVALAPGVLERYVGVYEIDVEQERVFTLEDGRLHTQRTGGARSEAFAASETDFFYRHSLSRFHFELNESGQVTAMAMQPWGDGGAESLVLHQGGRDVPGERLRR